MWIVIPPMALAFGDTRQPESGTGHLTSRVGPRGLAWGARALALQRVVAGISPDLDLDVVLRDVLAGAQSLFDAELAGLWLLGHGQHPLQLAAHAGLDQDLLDAVAQLTRGSLSEFDCDVARHATVIKDPQSAPHFGTIYKRMGLRSVATVPLVFRDEPIALLGLYHRTPFAWTPAELDLCASFGSQMASAVATARLFNSVRAGAARLQAIQELSARLNRIQDTEGIGQAIVAGMDRLIRHDTIRVYSVDNATGMCEPIAFHGEFMGIGRPTTDMLRVPIGTGLTGWVAGNNTTLRLGDAARDKRSMQIGERRDSESMLLVPMCWEDRVMGVIVVSAVGFDRYDDDDERTLEIFAGYAAQALANAEASAEIHRQRSELSHRLESQRRLLEVSEKLLSTLDPAGVLETIADSLKAVVAYDALTIYRIDWATNTRRALVARDRFADLILQHEAAMDTGLTGWVVRRREAVMANDAHLDPRVMTIPGTPSEPESLIICPLMLNGNVVGTLNVSRMGADEAHFTRDEFELVQLFGAQASIALRNAQTHGEVVIRAEHDGLTGLRNHGAFQRELGESVAAGLPFALLIMDLDLFKGYNDANGHPAGDALLARIGSAMRATLRDADRVYRYGGDEFAIILPGAGIAAAREIAERVRTAIARLTEHAGPQVTASVGIAIHPDDAATKDDLVAVADRQLYLVKPPTASRSGGPGPDPRPAPDGR